MKKIISIVAIAAASLLAVVSCEKEKVTIIESDGITVSPTTLTLIVGEVGELSAVIAPENATSNLVTWSTSDKKIASVSQFGRVSAIGVGTAVITAKNGKKTATCKVTVNPVKVTGVTVSPATAEVYDFSELTLKANVQPANATDKTVTWESSDKNLATVNKDGVVSTLAPGKVTITATTTDGGFKASAQITIKKSENLDVWVSDDEGSAEIDGGDANLTKDFLTYSKGKVTWPKNETGAVRKASLSFANGKSITVTQIGPADFAGKWSFTGKTFAPNAKLGIAAGNTTKATVTIAAVEGQTAKSDGRDITNNITISGLINTYVAEGVVDIDYVKKSFRIGIFFDGEKAQKVDTGKDGYGYITLLPELGNGWGSYNFCPVPFNNGSNKGWLWLTTDSLSKMHYGKADWQKCDGKDILGLAFCACKSATPKASDYASVNIAGGYDVIWQCNTGGANDPGFALER